MIDHEQAAAYWTDQAHQYADLAIHAVQDRDHGDNVAARAQIAMACAACATLHLAWWRSERR